MFFRTKLTIFFVGDCGICTVSISNKRFRIMLWTPHECNYHFLTICDLIFQCLLHGLYNTTQKTQKEQTYRHITKISWYLHIKILKKTITISTINHHILQKKKLWQTEIHKHNNNFRNSKSDKEHEQSVIILLNTFNENYNIHHNFHTFFTWF